MAGSAAPAVAVPVARSTPMTARLLAIRDAAPAGADAQAARAIRTGASVEAFRQALGAFTILDAMRAAQGQ